MKDRMTLGRDADARDTAALTMADERADKRIIEAVDYRHDRMSEGGAIGAALGRLDVADRAFASAVLDGLTWRDSGMTKQGFNKRLKKICDFISAR